jgi:hypothetical protein
MKDKIFLAKIPLSKSCCLKREKRKIGLGCDTMGERIGRIRTDFLVVRVLGIREKIKKIRINPPDPPNPFSHCITHPFFVMY